jgi:hypothetical protein
MIASAGLILYLNRGTTFYVDELAWLYDTPDLDVGGIFQPYGGHLIATTRLAYAAILHTIGPEYLAVRVLGVTALLLCTGLLFELMRRRIGSVPALAPTVVLLFFGSAWDYVAIPIGFSTLLSIAAGRCWRWSGATEQGT